MTASASSDLVYECRRCPERLGPFSTVLMRHAQRHGVPVGSCFETGFGRR